ncbi:MAG: NUDIX hydrolase [Gemmatimonadetes bacterium]|jgi:8-oxo-dGTP pyrophosphatase MutT (NUDIX family)|nr:NUDIX hydrolase [Gemmatimonadota bacterium]MBT7860546.1 NUDIX hydrolase [Gemmatimonadota bacterium]
MTQIDDSWYRRLPGIPDHISSGGIVARAEGDVCLIALAGERHSPGYIMPKGTVESGESLEETARREILEEAGIRELSLVRKLGVLERLSFNKDLWVTTHVFLFTTTQVEATPTDAEIHDHMVWGPIDDLPHILWPDQKRCILANRIEIMTVLGLDPTT